MSAVLIPSLMVRSTSAVISVMVAGDVPTLRSELASFSGWNAWRVPSDLVMVIEMGVGLFMAGFNEDSIAFSSIQSPLLLRIHPHHK